MSSVPFVISNTTSYLYIITNQINLIMKYLLAVAVLLVALQSCAPARSSCSAYQNIELETK